MDQHEDEHRKRQGVARPDQHDQGHDDEADAGATDDVQSKVCRARLRHELPFALGIAGGEGRLEGGVDGVRIDRGEVGDRVHELRREGVSPRVGEGEEGRAYQRVRLGDKVVGEHDEPVLVRVRRDRLVEAPLPSRVAKTPHAAPAQVLRHFAEAPEVMGAEEAVGDPLRDVANDRADEPEPAPEHRPRQSQLAEHGEHERLVDLSETPHPSQSRLEVGEEQVEEHPDGVQKPYRLGISHRLTRYAGNIERPQRHQSDKRYPGNQGVDPPRNEEHVREKPPADIPVAVGLQDSVSCQVLCPGQAVGEIPSYGRSKTKLEQRGDASDRNEDVPEPELVVAKKTEKERQ